MITGNEPAYPLSPDGNKELGYNEGLTIRQHFTAMAMQGLLAMTKTIPDDYTEKLTKSSVRIADALIAELNKNPTP